MRAATSTVETAVLQAIAYGDVFDYPLTAEQIHRYLVGVSTSPDTVRSLLGNGSVVSEHLACSRGYYYLRGRDEIVDIRLRREQISAQAWPAARRYGRIISRLPFVRMVAVSGALTMNNMEAHSDIDFFIVTSPGRLWTSRAMVIAVVQAAARRGHTICPNYFLSSRCLTLGKRNLFTAHELAQLVPIYGLEVYHAMCRLNSWAFRFLPNAFPPCVVKTGPDTFGAPAPSDRSLGWWRLPRAAAEMALGTGAGSRLESWEMNRKIRKFTRQAAAQRGLPADSRSLEVDFGPDRCKGHFDHHGRATLAAFNERLGKVSTAVPAVIASLAELENHAHEALRVA